jgi:hypothetical protein
VSSLLTLRGYSPPQGILIIILSPEGNSPLEVGIFYSSSFPLRGLFSPLRGISLILYYFPGGSAPSLRIGLFIFIDK